MDVSRAKIHADQMIAGIEQMASRKLPPVKTNNWRRILKKLQYWHSLRSIERFRATPTRASCVIWSVGGDQYGDTCLSVNLVQIDNAEKDAVFRPILVIRPHALARILQRTEHQTLEEVAAALPIDWLQVGQFSGALNGDRCALPLRGGYIARGEWVYDDQAGYILPMINTVLRASFAPNVADFEMDYDRMAGSLFDRHDAPELPLLAGEEATEDQKKAIFHVAELGRK